MTEFSTHNSFWGEVSGPPIVRKNPPEMPVLPSMARCFSACYGTTKVPSLGVEQGISASELLVAVRYANKLFDSFKLNGSAEFQASVVLFTRALGAGHKVEGHFAYGLEDQWLTDAQLTDLAYAAQDGNLIHRLEPEIQSRTNGHALCSEKVEAIKAEARTLGLQVQECASRTTVSRYLTICAVGSETQALEVRISDHGDDSSGGRINLRLHDSVEPVLRELRQQFGTPSIPDAT